MQTGILTRFASLCTSITSNLATHIMMPTIHFLTISPPLVDDYTEPTDAGSQLLHVENCTAPGKSQSPVPLHPPTWGGRAILPTNVHSHRAVLLGSSTFGFSSCLSSFVSILALILLALPHSSTLFYQTFPAGLDEIASKEKLQSGEEIGWCYVPGHCGEQAGPQNMPTNTSSCRATHMSLCTTGLAEKLERFASMMSLKPALLMFLASCKTAQLEVTWDMQQHYRCGSRRGSLGLRCWPGMGDVNGCGDVCVQQPEALP